MPTKTYTLCLNIPAYLDFDVPADATDDEILDLAQETFDKYTRGDPNSHPEYFTEDAYADSLIYPKNPDDYPDDIPDIKLITRNGILYKD